MKVLVCHPGIQHSYQLAFALAEHNCLQLYFSGVPVRSVLGKRWPIVSQLLRKLHVVNIPRKQRLHPVIFPAVGKFIAHFFSNPTRHHLLHRWNYCFDALAALLVRVLRPDVVIAYENSAKLTFIAGRHVGALCLLDAASLHPDLQKTLITVEKWHDPAWIQERKYCEIALADMVICCSDFAADSYRHAVPLNRLKVVALGTDLPAFIPRPAYRDPAQPLRFVFVGSARYLKGVDLLLDVFEGFQAEGIKASLTLVGTISDATLAAHLCTLSNVSHQLHMAQSALFEFLRDFDCLVLPSRFDSFGLVVPECMAVGLPAIVSDRVGAKCIIEQNPGAGWIVSCDVDSIRQCILDLIEHPEKIGEASPRARVAAEQYSWPAYRARVFQLIESTYRECRNTG